MIKKNTVLILGAGASKRYGYPLGKELKNRILEKINYEPSILKRQIDGQRISLNTLIRGSDDRLRYLLNNCDFKPDDLRQFYQDFLVSPRESIDAFLENRTEFLNIGKVLIALSILECERDEVVFNVNNNEPDWYKYLFNEMVDSWDNFSDNNISIVTYNYDRSFEYFFIKALISTFGKSAEEAIEIFDKIPLIHVHGKVGTYPWGLKTKPYNNNIEPEHIYNAVQNLHIIFEEEQLRDKYDEVDKLLQKAQQIFLLGFGFNESNLKRLNLQRCSKPIFASRTYLEDRELYKINRLTSNCISFGMNKGNSIVDFFKQEVSIDGDIDKKVWEYNLTLHAPNE